MSDGYGIVHGEWSTAPQGPAHPGVESRVVRAERLEVHRLMVERGGSSQWEASPGETAVHVIEGRLRLEVLGNRIDLDAGRYAVLPPNLPFALVAGQRSGAVALVIRG